ncbi:MAG: hypothetical protein EGR13_00380 [Coprococcus comes]|nr:hypothetical protein [Coprococcus comes]
MRLFKVNVSLLTGNFERIRWYTANAANRAARRGWHGDSLFEPSGEIGMAIAFSSRQARLSWQMLINRSWHDCYMFIEFCEVILYA